MTKKEASMQKIMDLLESTLEYIKEKTAQFEGFFDAGVSENRFSQSADSKLMLEKLEEQRQIIETAIAVPNEENIKRFVTASAEFATFCEKMAE